MTESVPWARHGSDFTMPFDDAVGSMGQGADHTAASQRRGISWATFGNIAERLVDELLDPDRPADLRRIGGDKISFCKRHRCLAVVTDHDTGNVVWPCERKAGLR